MEQKEVLRQEIELKLRAMCRELDYIKNIMAEVTWDGVSKEGVHKVAGAITGLMPKFNYTKG